MSDGEDDTTKTPAATGAAKSASGPAARAKAPRPSPAASAASRARRIGGAVAPAPPRPAKASPTKGADASPAVAGEEDANAEKATARKRPSLTKRSAPVAKVTTDADADADADTDAEVSTPKTRRPKASSEAVARRAVSPWFGWVPAAAFFAVAVVFLVLIIADKTGNDGTAPPSSKQSETVLAAAKNCVAATNTYKYTNVDSYEKAGLKCATGVYAKQYRNAMDTLIKKNAPTQKFTQLAQVNTAGIESITGDGKQWSVLIYGQLNITNTVTGKKGRIDPFAVVARMEQVKGKWLIAGIKLLSTPTS